MRPHHTLSLLLLAASSCGNSGGGVASTRATLIVVGPEEFLGDIPCSDSPGAMHSYVATLEDVTENLGSEETPIGPFVLPSSPPVPCNRPVAFGFIVPEHRYFTDIQAYERSGIEPLAPGSDIMVDSDSGETVLPRWTTSCGRQERGTDTAVVAREHVSVRVRGCSPLADLSDAATTTGISVSLKNALGPLECGTEAGTVATFSATPAGGSEPPRSASCGSSVSFDGLSASRTYRFLVTAFEAGSSEPRWGTTCYRAAQAGITVPAVCDPLATTGAVQVDVPQLLASANERCSDDAVVRVEVSLTAGDDTTRKTQDSPFCQSALLFTQLDPAEHQLDVQTWYADGAEGPAAICTAQVVPGTVTVADCRLL